MMKKSYEGKEAAINNRLRHRLLELDRSGGCIHYRIENIRLILRCPQHERPIYGICHFELPSAEQVRVVTGKRQLENLFENFYKITEEELCEICNDDSNWAYNTLAIFYSLEEALECYYGLLGDEAALFTEKKGFTKRS